MPLLAAVRGPLIVVASRCEARAPGMQASAVVARGLSSCGLWALERRLSSCGAQASLLRSMWDLPGLGLEPVSLSIGRQILNYCATREVQTFSSCKDISHLD